MVFKRGYTDLQVWQKSMDFVDSAYAAAAKFPREEIYGISSQMKRSAVSIPANLAEGCSRDSTKEFIRFVDIALGSLAETETYLMIAQRQKYIDMETLEKILEQGAEIGRMMRGLRSSLEKRLNTSRQPLVAEDSAYA